MAISIISTSIGSSITLGSGGYDEITAVNQTGTIASIEPGFRVSLLNPGATLYNLGVIGASTSQILGLAGGGGVLLVNGYVDNYTQIQADTSYGTPGAGVVQSGGRLVNRGEIIGGTATGALFAESPGLVLKGGTAINDSLLSGGTDDKSDGAVVSGGTLLNHGEIDSAAVYGGLLSSDNAIHGRAMVEGGTLINRGVIYNYTPGIYISGGTVLNFGSVTGGIVGFDANAPAKVPLYLDNTGTIAGGISLFAGGEIADSGFVGHAVNFGAGKADLVLGPGVQLRGAVTADAADITELVLAAGTQAGSIDLRGSFTGFNTIAFDSGAHWTLGGTASELASGETINGFAQGDMLVLEGVSATSLSFVTGVGLVLGAETLDVTGSFSSDDIFTYASKGGQTVITLEDPAPCFCPGTKIATPSGEVPVEDLAIGDFVRTLAGRPQRIRWIGKRAYQGAFIKGNHLILPVCIKAGALGHGLPRRDLHLSPGHAVYIEGVLVPAWRLVNHVSITQAKWVDAVRYIHLELAAHDVILAEGCPVESYFDNGERGQFHNAHEYRGAVLPGWRVAPLVEDGFALEALQRRLAGQQRQVPRSSLRGYVDEAGPELVRGWARDARLPETPVALDILLDGRRAARALANRPRADLRAFGGSGCNGFEWRIPAGMAGTIEVRAAHSGTRLPQAAARVAMPAGK